MTPPFDPQVLHGLSLAVGAVGFVAAPVATITGSGGAAFVAMAAMLYGAIGLALVG